MSDDTCDRKKLTAAQVKKIARPPCVSAPAPSDAQPRDLTPAELELLTAYRGMTPWARSLLLDTARAYLGKWPLNRAPSLQLISGGKS